MTRLTPTLLLAATLCAGPALAASTPERAFISDETGRMLRGLPGLHMFQRDFRGDDALEDVGCGPIAATNALLWWISRGYSGLADGFRTADGRVDWQSLAVHLRNEVLFTGAGSGVETWTLPESMENDLARFVESQGYDVEVTRKVVHDDDAAKALRDIRGAIDAGEPVILLYDPLDGGGDTTLGGMMHYGVIVGYDGDDVFLHEGLRGDVTERVRWNIGDGNVDLYFMHIDGAVRADRAFCVADGAPETFLQDAPSAYTFSSSAFDDNTMLVPTAGERCGILTNATTMAIALTDRNDDRFFTPGARVSVDVHAGFGGRSSDFSVEQIVLWLRGADGYRVLSTTPAGALSADDQSATLSGILPVDLAPGFYALLAAVEVVGEGRRSVLQQETGEFVVFANSSVTTVPSTKTASLTDLPGAWRSKSWLLQPGSGYFTAEIATTSLARLRILELTSGGAPTTVVDEVLAAGAARRHRWVDETGDARRLIVVETVGVAPSTEVSLTVNGKAVRILGWDTPDGHARLTASDGLGLAVGDSVDIAYSVPAAALVSATLQSTTSSLLASRAVTPGYVIEVIDVPFALLGDETTLDASSSPHRQRSGTVVARNDLLLPARVLFRITRTGLAAGFVLDVNVASVGARTAGSLVATTLDPDAFLYDTVCGPWRVDGQRPATHRLVRVPAGRSLRVTASAVTRNGVAVTAGVHVAERLLDSDGRALLAVGADVAEAAAAAAERLVLVELTGPQLLVGGFDVLSAQVCVALR